MTPASLLVDVWLVGFGAAAALQFRWNKRLASESSWLYAPGWQREIALWNLGMIAVVLLLRHSVPGSGEAVLPALALLSAILGTHHLVAALNDPRKRTHWAGVAGNALGVMLYVALVLYDYTHR